MRWFYFALLSSAFFFSSQAFVFYSPAPNTFAKWNANSSLLKASAMNPQTKAIRYYIAADAYSIANAANEINAIKAAFDQWQNIPGATVKFEFMGLLNPNGLDARYDNTNVVFWTKKSLRVGAGTQDLSNRRALTIPTLALDGSILDADIVLNGIQYQWFTNPSDTANQAQFVEAIVLHEIGHLLGLDHSTAGGATVIDGANGVANTDLGLSADELAAARFLYPDGSTSRGAIRGTVRLNGGGLLGAAVIAEDAAGNIAGATITQSSGSYAIYSLAAGTYRVRVTPLDPAGSGNNSLLRTDEIAPDYAGANTGFLATENVTVTLNAGETKTQDFAVTGGAPLRITSISKPTTQGDLPTVVRYAVSLTQGQSGYYVGVSSPGLQEGATLSVSGDGITVGATTFYGGKVGPGLNTLVAPIEVSNGATPGLRTLVVRQGASLAYANGYLEIAPAVPDFNFDGLDDRFQRKYWSWWTSADAAPGADPDNDGFSNRYEFRTETNPTDGNSHRLVLNAPAKGRFGPFVSWISDSGKKYQLYGSSSLASGSWQPIGDPVTAQGDTGSVPVSFDTTARFYRLELKR